MNRETLKKANDLSELIESLESERQLVESGAFVKRTGEQLREETIKAGQSAMLAVVDEAIFAAGKELESL